MEKIALLPGGFKPPHAGHYNMAKWLAANTDADSVVIKIGSKERDGITRDISLKLWDLYRKADENSNKLVIVPSEQNSPVKDVYDFIEQEAPEGSTVYLGMGEKDEEDQRFKNIGKFAEPKNIEFKTVLVPPQAGGVSGTEMRGFINNGDKNNFKKYLPDHLTPEQKDEAWNIVSSIEEDFYDPRNKTVDFMRSSEYKAGMPDGHKDDIFRKGDQTHNRQSAPVSWEENVQVPKYLSTGKPVEGQFYKQAAPLEGAENQGIDIEGRASAHAKMIEITVYAHGGTLPSMWSQIKLGDEPKRVYKNKNQWVLANKKSIPKTAIDGVEEVYVDLYKAIEGYLTSIGEEMDKDEDFGINLPNSPEDEFTLDKDKGKKLNEQQGGKTLRVYDFDDTLAVTKGANIKIKHTDGSIDILDPAEFAIYDAQEGDKFDFTEFDRVIKDAEPIQNILSMLEKDLQTTAKVTILTARLIAYPVRRYLKSLGLDAYVVAVGSSDPNDKAKWIENHIEKGYNDILFIDDSEKNRNAVISLKDKYPDIQLDVQDPANVSEAMMGTMNKKEKRRHKKTIKRIRKGLKKYNKKNRYFKVPKNWRGSLTRKYKRKLNETASANIDDKFIPLEIMDTPELQVQGMMGRDKLEGGMVFPYDKVDRRSFHMKDCKVPLDIIFIANNKINKIHHNCPPCQEKKCPQYTGDADNVLELPGGYCKENNIEVGKPIGLNLTKPPEPLFMTENIFTKRWWKNQFKSILLEGGAAGHMAHPFNLNSVNSGKDLIDVFKKSANSLQNNPGSVKIDGVNSSIRLVDIEGEKQFVMDRGSKKELDIKGITKADLEARFGEGHGMIKVGGAVLDMFNEALPSIKNDLEKLGAWDNPNILFNMEYVSGKTNVQDYGSNFIAIHGLNQIESKEVEGKRGMLTKRISSEISYDTSALQSLLDNLAPIAKEQGFEVYGSVPTEMSKDPNFSSALSQNYTIVSNEGEKTQTLDAWLNELNDIPEEDFIFMDVDNSKKKVGAVSKQVYTTLLNGGNVDELFEDENDKQKAIEGFTTYLATEKLGDEILKVLDSPMGSVENHEGVVIRDKSISNEPFKITGKFILGGMASDF